MAQQQPIKDFDGLLQQQVKGDKANKLSKKRARHQRGTASVKPEEESATRSCPLPHPPQPAPATSDDIAALMRVNSEKHMKEDEERQKQESLLTSALLKQQEEVHREAEFQRRKQEEDRMFTMRLIDIKEKGCTQEAEEPLPTIHDTHLRPKKRPVRAEFMTTPLRLSYKEHSSVAMAEVPRLVRSKRKRSIKKSIGK
eukprot:scaffold193_cov139-Amphora_coffeaeformis.AAC.3